MNYIASVELRVRIDGKITYLVVPPTIAYQLEKKAFNESKTQMQVILENLDYYKSNAMEIRTECQ